MKRRLIFGLYIGSIILSFAACGRKSIEQEESLVAESGEKESLLLEDSPGEETGSQEDSSQEPRVCIFEVEEGQLTVDIFQSLTEKGYGSDVQEWIELEQQTDITRYRWLSQISDPKERCFITEGYIMPGIYELPRDAEPSEILSVLLQGWEEGLTEEIQREIEEFDYSMDEILTMASIVEWEAKYGTESWIKSNVAAVILNRIRQGIPLQMDTSVFYLQKISESGEKDVSLYMDSYDTYQCSALPPGPICNPGPDAVKAVLHAADTENLFFVYQIKTGEYFFAQTYEEHLQNIEKAGIN